MSEEIVLGESVPKDLICVNRKWIHIKGVNEDTCQACQDYVEGEEW